MLFLGMIATLILASLLLLPIQCHASLVGTAGSGFNNTNVTPSSIAHRKGLILYEREGLIFLVDSDGSNSRQIFANDVGAAQLTPDAKAVAYYRISPFSLHQANTLRLLTLESREDVALAEFANTQRLRFSWSPKGESIAYVVGDINASAEAGRKLYVLNITDRKKRYLGVVADQSTISYSPDGRSVFGVTSDRKAVDQISLDNGVRRSVFQLNTRDAYLEDAKLSPNGKTVAIIVKTKNMVGRVSVVTVAPPGTEKPLQFGDSPTKDVSGYGMNWSPDGRMIAVAAGSAGLEYPPVNSIIYVGLAATGRLAALPCSAVCLDPHFSADGRQIVYVLYRNGVLIGLYRVDLNNRTERELLPADGATDARIIDSR
jgi:Tol biopolymer transport system component